MPSKSYWNYKKNVEQVERLLQAYETEKTSSPNRGRRGLDHFTRSALMFLCSSWEVYIEEVAVECACIIAVRSKSCADLPVPVKKQLSKIVKQAKNEIEVIEFASDWREYYISKVKKYTDGINTPKKDKVLELFHKYVGIEGNKILYKVRLLPSINQIVTERGEIAHKVFSNKYLKGYTIQGYVDIVNQTVLDMELMLHDIIPDLTDGRRPWRKTYK